MRVLWKKNKNKMNFKQETGSLIDKDGNLLHIFEGSVGSVSFDPEIVWALHKTSAGIVYAFCHSHPPNMTELSSLDKELLKGWAWSFYPFPARLTVITQEDDHFSEYCYFAQVESKESWLARNKETSRKVEIILEWHIHYQPDEGFPPNIEVLVRESYQDETN